MRLLLPLACFAATLALAQNPQPATRGLLVECNPARSAWTGELTKVRSDLFDRDNRRYGHVVANHLTYHSSYKSMAPYNHFCMLPTGQAVAWGRMFHGGISPGYVEKVWGTPTRTTERYSEYWLSSGWAKLEWKDGALASIDIRNRDHKLTRNLEHPEWAGTPLADVDTFGAMPAPVQPQAAAAASVPVAAPPAAVSLADAESLKAGTSRADVIAKLGAAHQRSSVAGGEGLQETLSYRLTTGGTYRFRLLQGKVTEAGPR